MWLRGGGGCALVLLEGGGILTLLTQAGRVVRSSVAVCMYVCKASAAPAHARTRAHRPGCVLVVGGRLFYYRGGITHPPILLTQAGGVINTSVAACWSLVACMYVCKYSAALLAHARTRAHRLAAPRHGSGVSQTPLTPHLTACPRACTPQAAVGIALAVWPALV